VWGRDSLLLHGFTVPGIVCCWISPGLWTLIRDTNARIILTLWDGLFSGFLVENQKISKSELIFTVLLF